MSLAHLGVQLSPLWPASPGQWPLPICPLLDSTCGQCHLASCRHHVNDSNQAAFESFQCALQGCGNCLVCGRRESGQEIYVETVPSDIPQMCGWRLFREEPRTFYLVFQDLARIQAGYLAPVHPRHDVGCTPFLICFQHQRILAHT